MWRRTLKIAAVVAFGALLGLFGSSIRARNSDRDSRWGPAEARTSMRLVSARARGFLLGFKRCPRENEMLNLVQPGRDPWGMEYIVDCRLVPGARAFAVAIRSSGPDRKLM